MSDPLPRYFRYDDGRLGLRRLTFVERPRRTLFCLPYAGGQSLAFRPLAQQLPADWAVWSVDPPGHGWSPGPAWETVDEMVDGYLRWLPAELFVGAIVLGHSLGGCVAFALARRLTSAGIPLAGLILSGARPPHRRDEYESFLTMDDARLLETLIAIGGVPAEWAREPEIFDHFKAALRADFRAFEHYELAGTVETASALALGAHDDLVCRPEHVLEWTQFVPGCRVDFLTGGHMFVQTHAAAVAQRIVSQFDLGAGAQP